MERSPHNGRGDDRGAVALEFVLALPFILMLIMSVVVLGSFLSVKTQTVGEARDAARAAALRAPLPAGSSIVGAPCPPPPNTDLFVTVAATKPVSLRSIPFTPISLPGEITETATMRCGG